MPSAISPCCKAADIFQPDPAFCGGISEAMKIGTIASAFNLRLAPHLWAGAPCFFAGLHVCAASPASFIVEYSLGANPMIHDLVEETVEVKDGMIAIPDKPGLGFTMSERFLEAHAQDADDERKQPARRTRRLSVLPTRTRRRAGRRRSASWPSISRVSRGQIREALAILEAMRIVERRAKSGIYLTTTAGERRGDGAVRQGRRAARSDPDLRDGRAAQDPRDQGGRTRLLARHRGEFRAAARDPASARRSGSRPARAWRSEDRDFHLEIVRATKNSVFHKICSVYYVMGEQRLPIYFSDPERGRRSHAEHLQIFDALLRRDGNLAQALMSAHLQGAESYWKGLIGEARRGRGSRRSRRPEPVPRHLFDASAASARRRRCWRRPASLRIASALDADTLAREGRDADIVIVRAPLPPALFERRAEAARRDPPRRRPRHDPDGGGDQRPACWSPTCPASMRARSPSTCSS